jgi:hypothetical protein
MIYILNLYGISNKGHFWHQDFYFRKIFRALDLPYLYLNSSAELAKIDDQEVDPVKYRYKTILNSNRYISEALEIVSEDIVSNTIKSAVIFFPWLGQFSREDLQSVAKLESNVKLSIVGVSLRKQASTWNLDGSEDSYTHQELFRADPFKILWIGEQVPAQDAKMNYLRFLPEYAEIATNSKHNKDFDLSFHGQLSSYRGLFEILIIALFNPLLKVHIRGYSFSAHRIWRPVKFRAFRYTGWRENIFLSCIFSAVSLPLSLLRYLPNVSFSKEPFEDENELDKALNSTRAVFYCSKLPHGSGLMTKSMSAGLPMIWNGLPGQASQFLSVNYPEGHFQYSRIFIPGSFSRKLKKLSPPTPQQPAMWARVLDEMSELKKYI